MLFGRPDNESRPMANFCARLARMPMTTPPAKVRGMLEKAPMAAAPKAWTTRKVRLMALRPMNGSTRMPEIAAKVQPIIHEIRRTRSGLVACIATRSGSLTTARIASPIRENRNSANRTTAAATPKMVTHSCG